MKKILLSCIAVVMFASVCADAHVFQNDFAMESTVNKNYHFQDGSFKISPNPSKNRLNIKLPKYSENLLLEVYDVLGKRIHKSTITRLESSIDVTNWKTGMYLVKITGDKQTQTKRFVKQ
ncbi:T9SS type A sorting domain-containing protein [uncultured Winogradskyella sp.]|uniref:T9SS type A sorting domain-containing protein n=1 Tax=Winogradskyella sp. 4-2091 TaxID=3381659 RepID=UPI002603D828|nr:T9SS type A sorting domain-containing protein [uncultured Winogradskyella sp.]